MFHKYLDHVLSFTKSINSLVTFPNTSCKCTRPGLNTGLTIYTRGPATCFTILFLFDSVFILTVVYCSYHHHNY